jgi:hypothetical protein
MASNPQGVGAKDLLSFHPPISKPKANQGYWCAQVGVQFSASPCITDWDNKRRCYSSALAGGSHESFGEQTEGRRITLIQGEGEGVTPVLHGWCISGNGIGRVKRVNFLQCSAYFPPLPLATFENHDERFSPFRFFCKPLRRSELLIVVAIIGILAASAVLIF